MSKQEEPEAKSAPGGVVVAELQTELAQLRRQLDQEKAKNDAKSFTVGKTPFDEMLGFVPQRDPVVSTLANGTKRVDF